MAAPALRGKVEDPMSNERDLAGIRARDSAKPDAYTEAELDRRELLRLLDEANAKKAAPKATKAKK